jgi:hypothetical protein
VIISQWILLRIKNVSHKIKTHILCSITIYRKSCRLWDNVQKCGIAIQTTDGGKAHAHCALDIQGYRYKLRICNTFIRQNPTRYNNISKFVTPYLYEAQHVSGDTTPIIRSLKLHWQLLIFYTWKVVGCAVGGPCQARCTWQRPPTTSSKTFHVWKSRGCHCRFRLMMMGGVLLDYTVYVGDYVSTCISVEYWIPFSSIIR